jgi:hypothetical protein
VVSFLVARKHAFRRESVKNIFGEHMKNLNNPPISNFQRKNIKLLQISWWALTMSKSLFISTAITIAVPD